MIFVFGFVSACFLMAKQDAAAIVVAIFTLVWVVGDVKMAICDWSRAFLGEMRKKNG